jgi:polynucleotide 5'-hydroxyl-kinase GRC3/NOL9
LDCDVGQPEFGLPGCLSLHLIREPVLEPVYLNARTPLLSFYLGDVSSKNEPAVVLDAIRKLYERYLGEIKVFGNESRTGKTLNKFEILTGGATERSSELPPLIVNTDGFIRCIGAEILLGVARTVRPSVIVQVASAKSSHVEAIEQFLREAAADACAGAGRSVEHVIVEPGRSAASRVAATDLRTLR